MPNTFITLDVPKSDGVGTPSVVASTGHPKSFVLSGAFSGGRYIVEGSNDGGSTWDILKDDDQKTEILFASRNAGTKTVDCIVDRIRVRAHRIPPGAEAPSITMGAPPAFGTSFFGGLDVPREPGFGAPLDLGLGVGPLKTFVVRGPIAPLSRFAILASMDGVQFDEIILFTADQQGARSVRVMCRYLRVLRAGTAGPPPSISVGAEPTVEPAGGGPAPGNGTVLTLSADDAVQNVSGNEEVMLEFLASLSSLGAPSLVAELSSLFTYDGAAGSRFRVRLGGTPGAPDGTEILVLDLVPGAAVPFGTSAPFPAPSDSSTVVKVTSQGSNAAVRGTVLRFRPALSH